MNAAAPGPMAPASIETPAATASAAPKRERQAQASARKHGGPKKHSVQLSWSPSPTKDIAGYCIYRAEAENGKFVPITAEPVTTTSYVDTKDLRHARKYFYQVSAIASKGHPPRESARTPAVEANIP